MTGASTTLLVISIVTLNIIWGYPWVGMFSACLSLLFVGWTMNRLMCPHLDFHLSLPRSATAEHPISIALQVLNPGRLPAMDFSVDFASLAGLSRRKQRKQSKAHGWYRVLSPPNSLAMLEPGHQTRLSSTIVYERRGVYCLPDVVVTSYFPFHLFRSFRRHPTETQIAITPRPLSGDEDAAARGMLEALGGWSHRLLSGDALDYTGSREYQVGMPVRRWDFNSWARLGRPIVREFQSPSVQLVTLIVDTGTGTSPSKANAIDPSLERVLSLAATAILSLSQKLVRVRLCVTSEALPGTATTSDVLPASDSESMLIRLADAQPVALKVADQRLADAIELVGRSPALVLTLRDQQDFGDSLPPGVRWLRVDPGGVAATVTPPHSPTARHPAESTVDEVVQATDAAPRSTVPIS